MLTNRPTRRSNYIPILYLIMNVYLAFLYSTYAIFDFFQVSIDHLNKHGHNYRASPDLWSAECRGFLQRQHRTEHGQRIPSPYRFLNNSPLKKISSQSWGSTLEPLDQKTTTLPLSQGPNLSSNMTKQKFKLVSFSFTILCKRRRI